MKRHLHYLSVLSLALSGGALFAENPPEGALWLRANNMKGEDEAGVSFSDVATWNEYSENLAGGGNPWAAVDMDVLPWELPWAADTQMNLKLDFSIVNVDSAIGSADSLLNVTVRDLWYSDLNIKSDFYITGGISQAGFSNLNINSGAKVSVNSIGTFDTTTISGAGTSLTIRDNSNVGDNFNLTNGAVLNVINNKTIYFVGTGSGSLIENSTVNGRINVRNDGIVVFKNSTLNAGVDNQFIESSEGATLTFDNSVINTYYDGWMEGSDVAAKWNGNVMFIVGGNNTKQTFTLKNGTVVNGGGSADGTSYWDMDEATRTVSDITEGGTLNLGWNAYSAEDNFIEFNIESGTQYAGRGIEFGNSAGTSTPFGSITVNQSGTDLEDGYTRVHLGYAVNIRASTFEGAAGANTFTSSYNLGGYTELITANDLNIGHNESRGGFAYFNISGTNNKVEIGANWNLNSGNGGESDASVNLIFADDSSNSSLYVKGALNTQFGTSGKHTVVLDGTSNSITTLGDFNLTNWTFSANQSANFKMLGEGNVLDVKKFVSSNGGTQDNAMGGSVDVLFKGYNEANKNKVFIRDAELVVQGSTASGSKFAQKYEFAGNTILRGATENSGVWLKLHEWAGKQYTSDSTFIVSGSGNDLLFSGLEIGKNNGGTGGGKGIFKIAGGGNRIEINEANATAHNGFKVESGGELHYAIQNSGTSTILDYTGKSTTFSGNLLVDFSDMTRATVDMDGQIGGWEKFSLYASYGTGILSSIQNWFTIDDSTTMEDPFGQGYTYLILNEEYVSVITRDYGDEYMFIIDESFVDEVTGESLISLSIMYKSTVPEPAAYAAVLGALALALAAYRRRK